MSKPEKPQPPDIEERLKKMRTAEVLEDLTEKFGLKAPAPTAPETKKDLGMSRVLADLNARKKRFLESLEGIPFHTETIPADEINQIITARKLCRQFVEDSERATEGLTKQEKLNALRNRLKELEAKLDELPLWTYKFSTESEGGGVADSEEMTVNTETDSVYFITPHGVSVRLKKSNLSEGLQNVITKFAAKIFFVKDDGAISLDPKVGYSVREYFGDDFDNLVWSGVANDFPSKIKIFQSDDGKVHAVLADDEGTPVHTGDRVNKIHRV